MTHCLYERAVEVLARLRGCAGSPEPSLLAYAISTKIACRGPHVINDSDVLFLGYGQCFSRMVYQGHPINSGTCLLKHEPYSYLEILPLFTAIIGWRLKPEIWPRGN